VSTAPATPVNQIAAGVLDVGYADIGPADGPAVVLLHGWPYDIHTFADVSPRLAAEGYRVIVPYLRGYGTTRFLSDETFRNGQQSALAVDTIALMDALGIDRAVLAGADWGARTADIVAALWPERCAGLVSVSGYLIGSQQVGEQPLASRQLRLWSRRIPLVCGEALVTSLRDDRAKRPDHSGGSSDRDPLFVRPGVIAAGGRDGAPVWALSLLTCRIRGWIRSIGSGKTIVEFCSLPISSSVCR
jgi:pimeloyl-ACP methyl ester carboxylesterase